MISHYTRELWKVYLHEGTLEMLVESIADVEMTAWTFVYFDEQIRRKMAGWILKMSASTHLKPERNPGALELM